MTDIFTLLPVEASDPSNELTAATAHNTLAGRSAAGAHPATAVSYDNTSSGLTADTVQEALDEIADGGGGGGTVTSVNGETGVVVLDAADVDAVPNDAVGLLPGETNRGTWDVAETYAVGDVVYEAGVDLFVATAPSTGAQPSLTPGSWDVLGLTGRHIHLGPGATSGDYGTSVGPVATSGDAGTAVGPAATAGLYGTAIGPAATAGDHGTAVGPAATAGDHGTAVGPAATAGDHEVNIANIYTGTLDPGDPTVPTGATIATGFVDLPETADVTNPAADHQRLIARTDGIYVRDQAGTEVGPLGAGGDTGVPVVTLAVGEHASLGGGEAVGSLGSPSAAGVLVAHPVYLPAGSYDQFVVSVTSSAASTWRFGIYGTGADPTSPVGASLITDGGTLNMSTTTGQRSVAAAVTVPADGLYWLAILCDAYTAQPTVHGWHGATGGTPNLPWLGHRNLDIGGGRGQWARRATGVATGAMPATFPSGGAWVDQCPQIRLRRS